MFQYEYEKRPPSASSCDSRATTTTDWGRTYPTPHEQKEAYQSERGAGEAYRSERGGSDAYRSERGGKEAYRSERGCSEAYRSERGGSEAYRSERGCSEAYQIGREQGGGYQTRHEKLYKGYEGYRTRPLPPRPVCDRVPTKSSVPLKVWVMASASCFAVCAVLVLATVVITRWGAPQAYTREMVEEPELIYSNPHPIFINQKLPTTTEQPLTISNDIDNEIDIPVIEKLSIFKNVVASREKLKKTDDLISKPQLHPIQDTTVEHIERKIAKKDQAKLPDHIELAGVATNDVKIPVDVNDIKKQIPVFKPTLPDVFLHNPAEIKLPDGYMVGLSKLDLEYDEYYNDDNLYNDYMQSNTMTNYLIEKVQELHDWITTDPDFETVKNSSKIANKGTEFSQVLKSLNESLIQGNVSIIMSTLKELYFGDNYTSANHSRKMIISNSTDLLSFGILTLDIMLLHNIQLMAWENQEAMRIKMLKDPDVFAFNALFMDPSKVEAKRNEILHHEPPAAFSKRQSLRQDVEDEGKGLLESLLEAGLSSARAAVHLGRAYKNTKAVLAQLSAREGAPAQLARNLDENAVAMGHLQNSFQGMSSTSAYTDLDCAWLLYCRNLAASGKLNPPYGTMARINGMALRMLAGELPTDKALESMVYEALSGWSELKCDEMFPRCSNVNAAEVVLETILQPVRKAQAGRL